MASCEEQAQLDLGWVIPELLRQGGDDCFVHLHLCEAHFVGSQVLSEEELSVGTEVRNAHEGKSVFDLP